MDAEGTQMLKAICPYPFQVRLAHFHKLPSTDKLKGSQKVAGGAGRGAVPGTEG